MAHHVLLAGGSGFVGRHLARRLTECGHRVTLGSRKGGAGAVSWDQLRDTGLPEGVTAVVNLAGRNLLNVIQPFWTQAVRKEQRDSRVETTSLLAELINTSPNPPQVFVSTSAVGTAPALTPAPIGPCPSGMPAALLLSAIEPPLSSADTDCAHARNILLRGPCPADRNRLHPSHGLARVRYPCTEARRGVAC